MSWCWPAEFLNSFSLLIVTVAADTDIAYVARRQVLFRMLSGPWALSSPWRPQEGGLFASLPPGDVAGLHSLNSPPLHEFWKWPVLLPAPAFNYRCLTLKDVLLTLLVQLAQRRVCLSRQSGSRSEDQDDRAGSWPTCEERVMRQRQHKPLLL